MDTIHRMALNELKTILLNLDISDIKEVTLAMSLVKEIHSRLMSDQIDRSYNAFLVELVSEYLEFRFSRKNFDARCLEMIVLESTNQKGKVFKCTTT